MGIQKTGKFFDTATLARLREQALSAQRMPAIALTQRSLGPLAKTEAELAHDRFWCALNAAAVAEGFPKPEVDADGDTVNYGVDFATGEILAWDGETEGTEGQLR